MTYKERQAIPILHKAGELTEGVQRCVICGFVLSDYRGAVVPEGQTLPKGWSDDGFVAVRGNTMFMVEDECEGYFCKTLIA